MKLILGLLILVLALVLQLWFPIGGVHGDFVIAALIAFAFIFPFGEFAFFLILAAFVINWQPGFGPDVLAFLLVPLAAFVLHFWLRWEPWIGVAVSTAAGVLALYGIIAPSAFTANTSALIADAIACIIFGEIVLWGAGN